MSARSEDSGQAEPLRLDLRHPAVAGRSGAGVTVAVIDSGVHASHPHVGRVAGGVTLGIEGEGADDTLDRLGHGTAVTAAIREKAPDAEIYAVKVFGSELATSTDILIRAIDWASERGIRLINLSLGTARTKPELALWACVERARERGSIVVSPREHRGVEWLPGCLGQVVGVRLDWGCPRHELRMHRDTDPPVAVASGLPRPIPGVPPERNLKGVSFAAANVTGLLALLLEGQPAVSTAEGVWAVLSGGE